MQVSDKTVKRLIQILVLIILGTGALMVIFIVGRLYVVPTDYLPPTIDPLVPSLDLSVTVTEAKQVLVSGNTDLPNGTLLMIHIQIHKIITVACHAKLPVRAVWTGRGPGLWVISYRSAHTEIKRTANRDPERIRSRGSETGRRLYHS